MTYSKLKKWLKNPKNGKGIIKFLLERGYSKMAELDSLDALNRLTLMLDFYQWKTGKSAV